MSAANDIRHLLAVRADRRHHPDVRDEWLDSWAADEPQRGERRSNLGDERSPWRRDRDRLYYSRSLQRLADVTQILHGDLSTGLLHNRLTHTLKVAQVARSIAERFRDLTFADPDVCDAGGLAHDLGHPPYGHVGEAVLNQLLVDRGASGYEGNAQTFRIVTKLSTHDPINPGLNFTRATLDATLKYPWQRGDHPVGAQPDRGVYGTETADLAFARRGRSTDSPSPEATIVDWADDISYAIHDFDDFYRASLISIHDFLEVDEADLLRAVRERGPNAPGRPELTERLWSQAYESLCELLESPENAPILRPFDDERVQEGLLRALTSDLISNWLDAIERAEESVIIDPVKWHEISLLKEYVYQKVIASRPETVMGQQREQSRLRTIFEGLERWVDTKQWPQLPGKLRACISLSVEEMAEAGADSLELARSRAISDFISQLSEQEVPQWEERVLQ